MKNRNFISVALGLVILITTIVVISCSEKETTQPAQPIENASSFETSIQHFMNHWLQPYKTSSQMQIDAALDSLELALNYKYGDATFQFSEFIIDTSKVQCQQLYDSISNYDLLAAYNKCVDSLKAQYKRVDASSKQLVYALVKIDTIIGSTVNINIIGGFGNGISTGWNFSVDDDWIYGDLQGDCYGQYLWESDGAEEIECKIHYRKPTVSGWAVWSDIVETVDIYGYDPILPYDFVNPNDPNPGDNYRDFLMFNDVLAQYICIPYNDLNFYLNGTETVLNTDDPVGVRPNGYTFISVELMGTLFGNITRFHIIENAVYGELNYTSQGPSPL